jgi:hypothetical protein
VIAEAIETRGPRGEPGEKRETSFATENPKGKSGDETLETG